MKNWQLFNTTPKMPFITFQFFFLIYYGAMDYVEYTITKTVGTSENGEM